MTTREELTAAMDSHARSFLNRDLYQFTDLEKEALRPIFTNSSKRVFLIHNTLPMVAGSVLLAMYSRMKNPRGIRGMFVDNYLPHLLSSRLNEVDGEFGGSTEKFLKAKGIKSLKAFVDYSGEAKSLFEEYRKSMSVDPEYLQHLVESRKVEEFNRTWLDKYGHNSIARVAGGIWLCFEQISMLAAKSIEWTRPGSGYIELSSRYVDMAGKDVWPIADELAEFGIDRSETEAVLEKSFEYYRTQQGDNFDGPFPSHLKKSYGNLYEGAEKDLEAGVFGETCDVLGNFLPVATLTSVGVSTSGEALPQIVKHLLLDATPETRMLAELIVEEGKKLGISQFVRHAEPTPWEESDWSYYLADQFFPIADGADALRAPQMTDSSLPPRDYVEATLRSGFTLQPGFADKCSFKGVLEKLAVTPRGEYDKLPNHFEKIGVTFRGFMSFRGWRDLHRQGFCTHHRTLVNPLLGFYKYDKSAPESFFKACRDIHAMNMDIYRKMLEKGVPGEMAQYPLALGNLVGFDVSGNLRQMEFSQWQRSKYSVNHEVRQIFLAFEEALRKAYPWWADVSRANTVPGYVFARGNKAIPLPK